MNGPRKTTIAGFALGLIVIVGALVAQPWNEIFQNLLIEGNLRVGKGATPGLTQDGEDLFVEGTLEVNGATQHDGTVTNNSTTTAAANLEATIASFAVSYTQGSTTVNVTGLTLGDADYAVLLEPTVGVSPTHITDKDSNGFNIKYQAEATATGRGLIVHY